MIQTIICCSSFFLGHCKVCFRLSLKLNVQPFSQSEENNILLTFVFQFCHQCWFPATASFHLAAPCRRSSQCQSPTCPTTSLTLFSSNTPPIHPAPALAARLVYLVSSHVLQSYSRVTMSVYEVIWQPI